MIRPAEKVNVRVDDDRVVVLAGRFHLVLTEEAAWELLASLSACLQVESGE